MKNVTALGIASAAIAAWFAVPAYAQIRQPGAPAAERYDLLAEIPRLELPTPDVDALLAEDRLRGDQPLRYGAPLATAIDSDSYGVWEITDDGQFDVWRIALVSKGAHSLGLGFSRFDLDPGATVFVYDAGREHVFGAYTESNERANGKFAIQPFPGDEVIVEYVVPTGPGRRARTLEIGEVVHDYRDVIGLLAERGKEDVGAGIPTKGCNLIYVNCPQGAPYQQVKRAAMKIFSGGQICTGSILNNTAMNFIPYMLTANHCGDVSNGIFIFNDEYIYCVGESTLSKTMHGAVRLATSVPYDSALYRLDDFIPPGHAPYHAGWDLAPSTGSPVATIGHSGLNRKVIAIDADGAVDVGTTWRAYWSEGYITGGHNGGPLFNAAQRVVGTSCCVSDQICGTQTAWFGQLSGFWETGGLAQWLDPLGTGATSIDGADPWLNCGSTKKYGTYCTGGVFGAGSHLSMGGCFRPRGIVEFYLNTVLGGGQALLFFGLSQAAIPMGNGCFLNVSPLLPVIVGPLQLNAQGYLVFESVLPATVTPGTFTMQAFMPAGSAPAGYMSTNGVEVTISP
jgi:lysyl endopeptidase